MKFFKELLSFNPGVVGSLSSKRFVLVIAGVSLSISVLILSVAAVYGISVAAELWAVTSTLAALAGVSYVGKNENQLVHKDNPIVNQTLTESK
jgi:hypothetical protein